MNKKYFFSLWVISVFFLASCVSEKNNNTVISDVKEYPVTRLIAVDTFYYTEYVSEINARQYIEVRARVKGFLESINVDEGKYVPKGTVMFNISDAEYTASLARMQAVLKNVVAEKKALELDMERVKMLVDSNVISNTELKILKAKVESLNARIEEEQSNITHAEVTLSYTKIRAPYDGIINRIPLKVGSLVDEGTLLTSLSDNSEVFAYFKVSEREYLDYIVHRDDTTRKRYVDLILADGSLHPFKGRVETIEGEMDPSTGSIAFRARFPNPNRILKHGASGKVRLTRYISNRILIPQKATFDIQDKHFVFVVDSNNRVFMKSFMPQQRISHFYVMESGLSLNETILYEGNQNVRDSMEITPRFVPMREILDHTH